MNEKFLDRYGMKAEASICSTIFQRIVNNADSDISRYIIILQELKKDYNPHQLLLNFHAIAKTSQNFHILYFKRNLSR